MLVVNIYSGPSSGKSTLASDVYVKLNRLGLRAEVPPEVAKIRSQRKDFGFLADQIAVFGETQHQINMAARSGADVAVLDSPVLLSLVYAPKPYLQSFPSLVREVYDQYQSLDYFLVRDPNRQFSGVGRVHNEPESKRKDVEIIEMLHKQHIDFEYLNPSDDSTNNIVQSVLRELESAAQREAGKPVYREALRA